MSFQKQAITEWEQSLTERGRSQFIGLTNRAALVEEEAYELMIAASDVLRASPHYTVEDLAHLFKEACDVMYVAYGMAHEAGADLDQMFLVVHHNNLMKLEAGEFDPASQKLIKPADHPKANLLCRDCGGLIHFGACGVAVPV